MANPSSSTPFELAIEKTVFVQGLNEQALEDDVKWIFQPYGEVEHVHLLLSPLKQKNGCGFVLFSDAKVAERAILFFNDIYTMKGCTSPLSVRFAHMGDRERYGVPLVQTLQSRDEDEVEQTLQSHDEDEVEQTLQSRDEDEVELRIVTDEYSRTENPYILYELLKGLKPYIIKGDGRLPEHMEQALNMARSLAIDSIRSVAVPIKDSDLRNFYVAHIEKILPSDIFGPYRCKFATLIVDAVLETRFNDGDTVSDGVDDDDDDDGDGNGDVEDDEELGLVRILKDPGREFHHSELHRGLVFQRIPFNRPRPLTFCNSKAESTKIYIFLLECNVDCPIPEIEVDEIKDAMCKFVMSRFSSDKIVVLSYNSHAAIDDVLSQQFEDRGIFHISVANRDELFRVKSLTGGTILGLTSVKYVRAEDIGTCEYVDELNGPYSTIGGFGGGRDACTITLGGVNQITEKAEEILRREIILGRTTMADGYVVICGGAVYYNASRELFRKVQTISDSSPDVMCIPYLIVFAKALKVASRQVVHRIPANEGADLLKHPKFKAYVEGYSFYWEPAREKIDAVTEATNLAISLAPFVHMVD